MDGFNPRAHAGRDAHALVLLHVPGNVSIHAPTQGATSQTTTNPSFEFCFNPRAHAGRDGLSAFSAEFLCPVSIHAPTQGATFSILK